MQNSSEDDKLNLEHEAWVLDFWEGNSYAWALKGKWLCIAWRYQSRRGCRIDVGIFIHFMNPKRMTKSLVHYLQDYTE
jgi:hypothetical protein